MELLDPRDIDVIAPNFKRRMSGVTSTVVRLVPLQARDIAIASVGPRLPAEMPRISRLSLLTMSRSGPSGPRVWHARRNVEMLVGLLLKHVLRKRLKLVFTSAAQRRHSGYTRWLISKMDAVIATSAKAAAYLERPATVVLHGIDTETFVPPADRETLRTTLGLDHHGIFVGCFGRLRPQKGTDLFVEAMCDLLPERPGVQALVMGGVTSDQRAFVGGLKDRIRQAGLAGRLRILPEDTGFSIAPWFQALDLFVAPQRWEGFGLTPLEAMASGVPVVATRVGAFEELVVEGETGALVSPGDVGGLTARIADLLDDPAGRAAMGRAARAHVEAGFRIEREAEAINAVYRSLLDEAGTKE